MSHLVVELGCEELPATFVQKAVDDFARGLADELRAAGILGAATAKPFATPRRLIVGFDGLLSQQPDVVKETRGPALKAAYDDAGQPTKALEGFCRSAGVELSDLRKDDQYVWADKKVLGKPSLEVIQELMPRVIGSLAFEKSMRWGGGRIRFARPIRWLLCAFDGQAVPFNFAGVDASLQSRGHRFYAPEAFTATSLDQLVTELRARFVEPDPERRRELILSQAKTVASGTPEVHDALVDENVFLTEWPTAIKGTFPAEYLKLPEPVLTTAMAKHERMFPVRDASGKLLNEFVFIRNSGQDAEVSKGCEWVLSARFNDAKFFFDEDLKSSLDHFLERTVTVVFSEKLGNVRQRADRLAELSEAIARATGADDSEAILARRAGLYAKADLTAGLVGELSSLQGVIGSEYALREGMLSEVAWALRVQYDPSQIKGFDTVAERTATRLILADQLDKLAGYLGLGMGPSGSSDPFALRRAATFIISLSGLGDKAAVEILPLFDVALELYAKQGFELNRDEAVRLLAEVFSGRYTALWTDTRHDVLEAAMLEEVPTEVLNPQRVRRRILMLEKLQADPEFVQTMTRPLNIVASAKKKEIPFATEGALAQIDVAALDSVEAVTLYTLLKSQEESLQRSVAEGNGLQITRAVENLADPIRKFFDSTMVMAEEEDIRFARLSLMQATSDQILCVGDFSKLVVAGT
ncbi:MAG: glycine--tRNA ligase subunit beta [Armatimonadetes bacterium]|nr:glycine--tRNA ligase subunit beta [Armatimonadota bacterium]